MLRHDVPRHRPGQRKTQPPRSEVIIKAEYQAHPYQVKALFSSATCPFPIRVFPRPTVITIIWGHGLRIPTTASMNGLWTDTQDFSNNCNPALPNVPGDGNFDQIFIPAPLQLQVGRVATVRYAGIRPARRGGLLRGT